jgi:prepilin-type N-terminal cleavage/methylation domain-containing protein
MIKKTGSQGFTLIELLFVIAIVGILTAVTLIVVNTARNNGADAKIKSNLSALRAESQEVFNSNNGSFGTYPVSASTTTTPAPCPGTAMNPSGSNFLFTNAKMKQFILDAGLSGGSTDNSGAASNTLSQTACRANITSWAIAVTLKSSDVEAWCTDSTGTSKKMVNNGTTVAMTAGDPTSSIGRFVVSGGTSVWRCK